MLNNLINRAVYKIFIVSDTNVIQEVRNFLGLHDIELFCEELKGFEKRLVRCHILS